MFAFRAVAVSQLVFFTVDVRPVGSNFRGKQSLASARQLSFASVELRDDVQALRPGGRLLVHDFMASNSVVVGASQPREADSFAKGLAVHIRSASFLVCYINAVHICTEFSERSESIRVRSMIA